MKNFAKTSCVGNSEVIYSSYKMYQKLIILRNPPQRSFCAKGKGDSNGRIEAGAAEKRSFAVDSHIPDDHSVKSSFILILLWRIRL